MDENLPTPIQDEAWKAEIERAKNEKTDALYAPQKADAPKSLIHLVAKGVLIAIFGLALLMAWVYADNALLPFDAAAWKANVGREKQVGRLRRQVKLVGMNRQKVVQLLGKPDESSNNRLVYIAQHSGDNSRLLVIELQKSLVTSSRLVIGKYRTEQSQQALGR